MHRNFRRQQTVTLKRSLVALAVLGLTAAAAANAVADDEVGYDDSVLFRDGFDAQAWM
jgi:hypothetical protein